MTEITLESHPFYEEGKFITTILRWVERQYRLLVVYPSGNTEELFRFNSQESKKLMSDFRNLEEGSEEAKDLISSILNKKTIAVLD
jgi:hypothetical protein